MNKVILVFFTLFTCVFSSGCGVSLDVAQRHHMPGMYINISVDRPTDPVIADAEDLVSPAKPDLENIEKQNFRNVSVKHFLSRKTGSVYSKDNAQASEYQLLSMSSASGSDQLEFQGSDPLFSGNYSLSYSDNPDDVNEEEQEETTEDVNQVQEEVDEKPIQMDHNRQLGALVLVVLLGIFGAHRFYLGYRNTGLMMLIITLLSFTLLITGVIFWIDMFYYIGNLALLFIYLLTVVDFFRILLDPGFVNGHEQDTGSLRGLGVMILAIIFIIGYLIWLFA